MLAVDVPSEQRVTVVVVIATWVALAVGIFTSVLARDVDINVALGGAGAGALWVLAVTVLPHAAIRRPLVLEGITLFGVATTIIAVALTGTIDSQFLLLSVTPTMYAAIHGGFRVGLGTAGLSALLLGVVTFAQGAPVLSAVTNMALYVAVGATIAQIRRLLLDVQRRSAALEKSSLESEQRLQSLEGAHTLLAGWRTSPDRRTPARWRLQGRPSRWCAAPIRIVLQSLPSTARTVRSWLPNRASRQSRVSTARCGWRSEAPRSAT